ncbi:MAG: DUF5665 domain-containing protein [Fimbriimonadaceae bacterium]
MEPDARGEAIDRLIEAVEKNTQVLERFNDLRRVFLRGMIAGFGGLIGATILISLLFTVLEPLKGFQGLGPAIERLADELERQPAE